MKLQFLIASLAFAAVSHATLINAGFESPAKALGTFTSNGIDGWSTSAGSVGVWHLPSGGFFAANAPEGLQIGYSNGNFVAQQSTDVLQVGLTELTAMGGRRTDSFAGSFALKLWVGGTVVNGDVIGGVLLGSTNYVHTDHNPTTFSLVTVDYTALDGDANLGKLLTVQFVHTSGSQMDFDDAQLHTPNPVPEPMTMVALGAGVVALARKRKK